MADKQPTPIASLGEFGLIDRLTARLERHNDSTLTAVGDDAAVIDCGGGRVMLVTTDMMTEGIDFDLTYFPLKHLGYKVVTRGVSDILAMNARPRQILLSLGVSAKISVEALE
ncbi:MAG: thiamine-phosphate kinase, partial [Alistipes sp.]|nr:thiamine-phosphate kinase [Alistipes sp.]